MNQKTLQQSIGTWAEQTAWQYLHQHGWRMLEQNYHSVFGEIDIANKIIKIHDLIIFKNPQFFKNSRIFSIH